MISRHLIKHHTNKLSSSSSIAISLSTISTRLCASTSGNSPPPDNKNTGENKNPTSNSNLSSRMPAFFKREQQAKAREIEFATPTPGTIVQRSPIRGRPDMTVIDIEDRELDQQEASDPTTDEKRAKLADRRQREQNAVMHENMRRARREKMILYLGIIAVTGSMFYMVPHFVRNFKVLMDDRNQKAMLGPVERPEDFDEKTGTSKTLDQIHPKFGKKAQQSAAFSRPTKETSASSFLNKGSAMGTANFKKNKETATVTE